MTKITSPPTTHCNGKIFLYKFISDSLQLFCEDEKSIPEIIGMKLSEQEMEKFIWDAIF